MTNLRGLMTDLRGLITDPRGLMTAVSDSEPDSHKNRSERSAHSFEADFSDQSSILSLTMSTKAAPPLFRDPAFMENRQVPVHRWVPWIAGFSASFVQDCITHFLGNKGRPCTVLDPFAGVGTTILTALENGHHAIGFEINPYAALACRAKIEAARLDLASLDAEITRYSYASSNGSRVANGASPTGFQSRISFFSPRVEEQVHGFLSFLKTIDDPDVSDLFSLAFGSVMVSFSNYTYEPSLSTRPGAGKPLIEDADVHATILQKLLSMREDVAGLQMLVPDGPSATIHCMDFMDSPKVLPEASVDLAITSPPYLNNYHYIRSTRPHLYWLGLVAGGTDLRELEQKNVGKYWQTVRAKGPIKLAFEDPDLERVMESVRNTRKDKGVYGGTGWANYIASYFNDSDRFLSCLGRALTADGTAVIVVGNSIIQGHEVKVEQVLSRMARRHGMQFVQLEQLRTKRVGASITKSAVRRGESSDAQLYETAVILRRER
jgi:hypothetical protein